MTVFAGSIDHAEISEITPLALAAAWARVRETIASAEPNLDRRGFRLLHWPPIRPNPAGKPIELSLEHEARLRADHPAAIADLVGHLDRVEGNEIHIGDPRIDDLVVRRVARAPGAQSVDRYWDVSRGGFAAAQASLRQRIRTSKFMTWSGGDADAAAVFNLELPLVALGRAGVVARLEFNWIDDRAATFAEFEARRAGRSADPRNPLVLALDLLPTRLDGDLAMVVEHTTFREKYSLRRRLPDGTEVERFQMNIDHMIAQSLATGHFGHHVDVDVAAAVPVDEAVLVDLDALAATLGDRFALKPANAPKYAWDLRVIGA
jgi:hypothetical protein